MADVHALISLGLGSPADIPHLVLFGLSINLDVADTSDDGHEIYVAAVGREIAVPAVDREILVDLP